MNEHRTKRTTSLQTKLIMKKMRNRSAIAREITDKWGGNQPNLNIYKKLKTRKFYISAKGKLK